MLRDAAPTAHRSHPYRHPRPLTAGPYLAFALKIRHIWCRGSEAQGRGGLELRYHLTWCARCGSGLVSCPSTDLRRGLITQQSATSLKRCWLKSAPACAQKAWRRSGLKQRLWINAG